MSQTVHVLVVDDEQAIRDSITGVLEDEGYETAEAEDGELALRYLASRRTDIMLLDIWLPGQSGMEILARVREQFPSVTVIMISGHGTVNIAVEAIKQGAFDFIEKPLSIDRLLMVLEKAKKIRDLEEENRNLKGSTVKEFTLIGASPAMTRIRELIASTGATNGRVLVTGENGTGKEIIARSIHVTSERRDCPFIEVNCAAIPENLIESELFGHEKGSFTGALEMRKGKFELADKGTIFLDEIADMSLQTQAKVLRVLQEMEFERVGGTKTIHVDVRVIAATNKDLREEIATGNFREDLYYRLNVIPVHLPALRDRLEDMEDLVRYFSEHFCRVNGRKPCIFTKDAIELMQSHDWPGNIRELRNVVERVIIMLPQSRIDRTGLESFFQERKEPENQAAGGSGADLLDGDHASLKAARDAFEKEYIIKKLKENGMNVSKTAKLLGIERSNLHRKINSLGIECAE
jgi:two-component system nitrogen regulation response regulator NtrX